MTPDELARLLAGNPDLSVAGGGVSLGRVPLSASPTKRRELEHAMQKAVVAWTAQQVERQPLYALLFAIPNGGDRNKAVAGKMQAEGVKAGVLDLFLPVPRHSRHGLFIECKIHPNKPSDKQVLWIRDLLLQGYAVEVVYDEPARAIELLRWYVEG